MPRAATLAIDVRALAANEIGEALTRAAMHLTHRAACLLADPLGRAGARSRSAYGTERSAILRRPPSDARPMASSPASRPDARHDSRTDEELVVAHRTGDADALRQLIERHQGDLHGFLTRLVGSRAGADDVFQEAFLQVHLSADSFDAERRFKPWLYTIAANKGRDYLRRQRRRAAASLDAPVGDGSAALVDLIAAAPDAPGPGSLEASDESAIVKGVVDDLPAHFREILLLAYFQKMSYAQISESLGIPLGTVKSRLHAALTALRQSWGRADRPAAVGVVHPG